MTRERAGVLAGGRRGAVIMALGTVLVLAGCSGATTGATNVTLQPDGSSSAQLNGVGSCDTSCTAFMRWRVVGTTTWTNAPAFSVGKVSNAPWHQTASGLSTGAPYEYQACAKEASWDTIICVGPNGQNADRFTTLPRKKLSSDPYTNSSSQHATQVEPDTFASGSSIVSAFQSGRFFSGGASNIGWASSTDGGSSWSRGFLPGITTFAHGSYAAATDPSVAYDAAHHVWLIASLPLTSSVTGAGVLVNRSTDGGATWGNPVAVALAGTRNAGTDLDKNWVVCDNTSTSPFYGHCYAEWDDFGAGDKIKMSTSTDGGLTWGAARETANAALGLGGQPVVQPSGTVVVPINNLVETAILAFTSTDGGATWGNANTVTAIPSHTVGGDLRSSPLPSAEIDAAGKVYVVWQDCRFRSGCAANDIVMSTSTNGVSWSPVVAIPIDPPGSSVDHFIPGLAVDKSTSGFSARLALTYYYYPNSSCTTSTCQLDVGLIASADGGQSWGSPVQLAGPMATTWLANTSQGYMVGDYISTSFSGSAHPVFAVANPPSASVFDEAMATSSPVTNVTHAPTTRKAVQAPVVTSSSDHAASKVALTSR